MEVVIWKHWENEGTNSFLEIVIKPVTKKKKSVEGQVIGENRSPTQKHNFLQCTHQLFVILHLEKGTSRMNKKVQYQNKYRELRSSQT